MSAEDTSTPNTAQRTTVNTSQPTVNSEDASSEPSDGINYFDGTALAQLDAERRQKRLKRKREFVERGPIWSILAFSTAMAPVLLWWYCYKVSGGSSDESGPGAIWWLVIMYYWSIGLPLFVISIVAAITGLRTSWWWLSVISLLIKIITVLFIAMSLF